MRQTIEEYCDSRGAALRVERHAGVMRGVKVLGLQSRNGRRYRLATLRNAVGLYENAKVNVNHPKGSPLSPRDYQDRIGVIRNVQLRDTEGLFADFHFNPKHTLAEQLAWDAEHNPENVGFSHNVEAVTSRNGDEIVVEEIVKVQGVDLVADPATTKGLFEAADSVREPGAAEPDDEQPVTLREATLEQLHTERPDLEAEVRAAAESELVEMRAELDRLRAKEKAHQRRHQVRQLLAEYHLPDPETAGPAARTIVSEAFLSSLLSAPDENAARELVAERARLLEAATSGRLPPVGPPGRPCSRDQYQVDVTFNSDVSAAGFVRAIT